ncbi:hypothetical protein [Undibacterium sp. Di24W]|uniref:hypothetical protein n=1 Tax=Undibacterium sp. Di24W TaxID=3413033 RepID=UPI003BF44E21
MLKNIAFLVLLCSASAQSFAQEYVDKIAKRACDCSETAIKNSNEKTRSMEIGFCILNAADAEDKKKFKKDFNLDFNEIDKNGEKIGKLIGMKMAPICPTTMMALANAQVDKEKSNNAFQSVFGEVIKIEKDFFVSFVVRESNGNSSKLLWTSPIETNIDMANQYLSLQGKSLQFSFENQNIFDPKIGEYRSFKIIKKINSK